MNIEQAENRLASFTPDRIREMAAIMQAAANGLRIQNRKVGGFVWLTAPPVWDWSQYDYRIEPQPREVWIEENDLAHLANGKTTFLRAGTNPASKCGYVKFREVL